MPARWLWMLLLGLACVAGHRSMKAIPRSSIYKNLEPALREASTRLSIEIRHPLINATVANQTEANQFIWRKMRRHFAADFIILFFTIYIIYLAFLLF